MLVVWYSDSFVLLVGWVWGGGSGSGGLDGF